MAERLVRDLAIEDIIQIEIKATLAHKNQSYVQWCARSDEYRNKNKVKLTITYYMVWQKISSGRRYESSIGHAFIIGGIYKGIIGVVLYSKSCRKLYAAYKRGEESD